MQASGPSCSYGTISHLNKAHLNPILNQLVKTAYFRYFKVNLWCDCSFWPDDGLCAKESCAVCECPPEEIPSAWVSPLCSKDSGDRSGAAQVNRTMEPGMSSVLESGPGWQAISNPWFGEEAPEIDREEDYFYVNLLTNPEQFTGYEGEHPHRVWSTIYASSCLSSGAEDTCEERRILYRLISGVHASISAHIAADYLLDESTNTWGPNLQVFKERLGTEEVADRIENLYFAYLFVLRAVMKVGPLLESIDYQTGLIEEDTNTANLVSQLVGNPQLVNSCPLPFDEGRMWTGDNDSDDLRSELQNAFRNISRVMNCVGCEKCKLWGKLQILGVSTALKVLFEDDEGCSPDSTTSSSNGSFHARPLQLERNEVIALLNLLQRLSASLETVRVMSQSIRNAPIDFGSRETHPFQAVGHIIDSPDF